MSVNLGNKWNGVLWNSDGHGLLPRGVLHGVVGGCIADATAGEASWCLTVVCRAFVSRDKKPGPWIGGLPSCHDLICAHVWPGVTIAGFLLLNCHDLRHDLNEDHCWMRDTRQL
jgi:hypothetical protein